MIDRCCAAVRLSGALVVGLQVQEGEAAPKTSMSHFSGL